MQETLVETMSCVSRMLYAIDSHRSHRPWRLLAMEIDDVAVFGESDIQFTHTEMYRSSRLELEEQESLHWSVNLSMLNGSDGQSAKYGQ